LSDDSRAALRLSAQATGRHSSRRGFLAGGAAAAFGAGDLLHGQRKATAAVSRATADAASLKPAAAGHVDVVMLTPSGDKSGATDAMAINSALTSATPGIIIWLDAGTWYIDKPISMPPYGVLQGTRGGVAAYDTSPGQGTVIRPVSGFSSTAPVSAAIVMVNAHGVQLRDFTIDGSDAPSAVDGIASYGSAEGIALADLGIYGLTGYGINCTAPNSDGNADGWKAFRILIQRAGSTGWFDVPSDTTAVDVHVQNSGGDGFTISSGGNTRFIGCRADLSAGSGWVIDHSGGSDGYTDATVLAGCGTQRNQQHGVKITNSSPTGTDWRDPVVISGCSFDEDGAGSVNSSGSHTGGQYAGIWIEGSNRVWITGSTVLVGTVDCKSGCPRYGLATAPIGTASGVPELIVMTGGHLNYAALGAAVYNADSSHPAKVLYLSPDVTSSAGYHGAINSRMGTSVLSRGSATVTSPWLTADSRIFLSNTLAGGTPGFVYVSSRTAGHFTISSTSRSDTSQIAWMIVSDEPA
jgi:hypothetical protein